MLHCRSFYPRHAMLARYTYCTCRPPTLCFREIRVTSTILVMVAHNGHPSLSSSYVTSTPRKFSPVGKLSWCRRRVSVKVVTWCWRRVDLLRKTFVVSTLCGLMNWAGASTPYKRWSKCAMKKYGGKVFCRNLGGGEVRKIFMHFPGHQVSDFKAKMHQIRFPLGLRPRPRWWS